MHEKKSYSQAFYLLQCEQHINSLKRVVKL